MLKEKDQQLSISDVIRERRTIRSFKDDPISKELILELLNDAVWAPNHGHREPWRFILVHEEARTKVVHTAVEIYREAGNLDALDEKQIEKVINDALSIPAQLIIVMKEEESDKKWEEDFAATSALIQNFQLLAWEKGLGVVWKTNPFIHHKKFHEATGIQENEKVIGLLQLGYPVTIPEGKPRTSAEEKLTVLDR